jgi:uncharacterized Zn finger protein (UPF0148 family)
MLDEACEDCGNPVFRYQGEVFCPVCQERRGREGIEESDGGGKGREGDELPRDEGEGGSDRSGPGATEAGGVETDGPGATTEAPDSVEENLRLLARRLARDAAESAEDPDAVERRLEALERTLDLLR